jgi:hypothetical protein
MKPESLGVTQRIINKAGHALPLERPTDVANEIRNWMIKQNLVEKDYFDSEPNLQTSPPQATQPSTT